VLQHGRAKMRKRAASSWLLATSGKRAPAEGGLRDKGINWDESAKSFRYWDEAIG